MKKSTIGDILLDAAEVTIEHETMPVWALAMKITEENGELQEALLKELGFLQHKVLKESPMYEAADVIICVIGVLAKLYTTRGFTADQIMNQLRGALDHKMHKYKERILQLEVEEWDG